jgi:DNA polymerase-3 subunit epsilon
MKLDARSIVVMLAPGLLLAVMLAAAVLVGTAHLDAGARAAWWRQIEPQLPPIALAWIALSFVGGALARWAWQRFAAPMGRVAEQIDVLATSGVDRDLPVDEGGAGQRALAASVNGLIAQRRTMKAEFDAKVQEAAKHVGEERERLAALMSELSQSVVVCNLDGRILLYNNRARMQFRALSQAPGVAGGAELIGLGRSIYAVLDRRLIAHALDGLRRRMQRGASHPQTQFVTGTKGGQLLRIQLAPVRTTTAAPEDPEAAKDGVETAIGGFVLVLDNITSEFADEVERDRMLHALTEASRASLGNLQAAVEILDDPELDAEGRGRFQAVVRDEAQAMTQRIRDLSTHTTQTMKTRWPLEPMLGADLVDVAVRRIEAASGVRAGVEDVDGALWIQVDSFSVVEVLAALAQRLREEQEVEHVRLRLGVDRQAQKARARLDLLWIGRSMSTETVIGWETDTLRVGAESIPVTVRDVVERHGGAFWFERERVRQAAFFRFLLPLSEAGAEQSATALAELPEGRPEYFDFDLFRTTDQAMALADRRLTELSFTVFDTETTGLQPSEGDEIIQIGATRIVGGKIRRHEVFEQLVDPQRSLPEAGIAIHGITPPMLEGQPTIDTVLPAFHAFAADTVLVGHNAAFDMRFLQLKEKRTGLRFDQPVLDTLLLSPILHPQQETHKLEAIAQRLGVEVLGRHTALGDAMVTAEVFLKMIPLLEAQGITTLGQVIEASRKSMFAKVAY